MKFKQKVFSLFLVAFTSITLTACLGEDKPAQAPPKQPPVPVEALQIKRETLDMTGEYMGKAMGFLSVEVRAQIAGILVKKHYKSGDFVKQGQLLFEIDPSQAQAALNQAKARLTQAQSSYNQAKREWDRIQPLAQRNAVSQRDKDQAESAFRSAGANVGVARAAVDDAQIRIGYTKVVAPISGYTSLNAKDEGNLISLDANGSLLTVINQTDPMYINFSMPGSELSRYARLAREGKAEMAGEGARATATMMDGSPYPYEGKVNFIDTQIDPYTNTLEARTEFPNPNGGLLPNMFAKVKIYGNKLINVIIIPQSAVLQTAKGPMVYVINRDNTVSLRPIILGDAISSIFLVQRGLDIGDVIVTAGITKIHEGREVIPTVTRDTKTVDRGGDIPIDPNDLSR